jgi:putative spermidine/putrescine transport system substrate-binding protein
MPQQKLLHNQFPRPILSVRLSGAITEIKGDSMTRSSIAIRIAMGLAAVLFTTASFGQAKKFDGVTLHINGYGGAYDEVLKETVAKPLKEKYGLDVVYDPAGSTVAVAKLLASKDNPPYDVLMADSPGMPALLSEGVLDKLTQADVPNLGNVYPQLREFGDYGAPFLISAGVLTYNSKDVKNPPKSIRDLARPEYKGKVALMDLGSSGGVLFLAALADSNGGSVNNVEPGLNLLKTIKPNVVATFGTTVSQLQAFQQGDASLGYFWDGRVYELETKNVPLVKVAPTEGIYAVFSYVNLVKGTKNREAALAYINQALSDEAVGALVKRFTYGPTTNVKLPEDLAKKVITYGPEGVKLIKPIDWSVVAKERGAWVNRWNSVMR